MTWLRFLGAGVSAAVMSAGIRTFTLSAGTTEDTSCGAGTVAYCAAAPTEPSSTPGFFLSSSFLSQSSPPESENVGSVDRCCDFIDARCPSSQSGGKTAATGAPSQWSVEATDFSSVSSVDALVSKGKAALQIMRLGDVFHPQSSSLNLMETTEADAGSAAPVMRLVGFFPGASPAYVYKELMDVPLRFAWDTNYLSFDKFTSPTTKEATPERHRLPCYTLDNARLRRPLASAAPRLSQCVGDTCRLIPAVETELLDDDWLCHKVGSSFLSRFGIMPRILRYERVGYVHRLTSLPNPTTTATETDAHERDTERRALAEATAYDILYAGSRQGVREARRTTPSLDRFLSDAERTLHAREGNEQVVKGTLDAVTAAKTPAAIPVDVNYQHILLLPIADLHAQLLRKNVEKGDGADGGFNALVNSGSVRDVAASKMVYRVMRDTAAIWRRELETATVSSEDARLPSVSGTLLVMTSANDASVPSGIPLWLQRKISSVVSHQAYGELTEALKKDFP